MALKVFSNFIPSLSHPTPILCIPYAAFSAPYNQGYLKPSEQIMLIFINEFISALHEIIYAFTLVSMAINTILKGFYVTICSNL